MDEREEAKLLMSRADAHEGTTTSGPVYELGSYRASTSTTPVLLVDLQIADLQKEIADLGVLRNQIAHAQSVVLVSYSQLAFNGVQPDFVTVGGPAREYLPNHVEMGGAAATFIAGTSGRAPAIGAEIDVIPSLPMQTAYVPLSDSFSACSLLNPSLDPTQQHILACSPANARSLFPWKASPESRTSPSEPTATQALAPVASCEIDDIPTTPMEPNGERPAFMVAVRLDEEPRLRAHLMRLVKRRRARLGRVVKHCRITRVQLPRRPRPASRNLTLVMLAVSRRYGRRSEPDDYTLPAHRWTSGIGGETALSC